MSGKGKAKWLAHFAMGIVKAGVLVGLVSFGVWALVTLILLVVPRSAQEAITVPEGSFAFAALGDAPYGTVEFKLFDVVLGDLTAHELASVIHVGDIFSEICLDEAYRRTLGVFSALEHPVVYTPGDNEWTDCYYGTEESDPYNRLASIRDILFADPAWSLGAQTIPLEHQGNDPIHGEFLENARWQYEGVVFATVHLVGSSNAMRPFPGRTQEESEEPGRRTEAAAAWVQETFRIARDVDAAAVVLAFHANVAFEQPVDASFRQPYEPFLQTLEEEVAAFERPVLGIHGDFHEFIVDQPLIDRGTGEALENFTRVQVPGSPAVGWVHVTVTAGADNPFHVEPRVVSYGPS